MADWAGAVAAMRARLEGGFNAAPVEYQNEDPPQQPWPPASAPWIFFEVIETQTTQRGVGTPGNKPWLTVGHMFAHVFAPKGYGLPDHLAIAGAIMTLYRGATFYNTDPDAKVVCIGADGAGPSVQGGDSKSGDGNQFGVTVAIPFQFYFTA